MEINLISDTVTKPTEGMLKAIMNAEVGDDVFGADPTVNLLQDKVAKLFGMEAALFFPSGTMANQAAIKIHTQPGDRMFCDKWAHVYNYEGGGAAFNSGVTSYLIDGDRGMFTAEQLENAVSGRADIHVPFNRLVCIENTTNKGGGACWDFEELVKIGKVTRDHNLAYHLDGARLFNALVAKNETPQQYGELFDTISICLSKGLGAPVGSVLVGSKEHIEKALRVRKLFGGGMRQAGFLAAAGIYALDNLVDRLADDHSRAKAIGEVLENCSYVKKVEPIETNIVIFYVNDTIDSMDFIEKMKQKGILLISMGEGKLRIVTHLDFTDEMLAILLNELKSF
ncbi:MULTISPECIES: threonine aldolase family protein [unclassified Tenacibaculum]|uniref:threonine aldolase family protein n=1 Tax=unclassified Tenacibaculum TaxID=2635139 RepID=UPI001F388E6F|nr:MULTISPECIES: GntG family PLP-dependent aldolase [unclassified Tenacibaculum]MCF2873929.1 aminotransferase class I/II-fold pyridoxal phosphate-dependent enzyme [Tenacibaculum sp. Cn5-1]MCF2934510.1 aminotransferase class I/II-fold pyridoxal phosphate-dependent enzyme [Tenacibaculum sp. Cn5-34]MCG7510720.1 aminotransferase class I/II-fold pyridoxal phosphate-dependent enzyme [Tenacibaculum sp. Cn5-46]